MAKKFLTDIDLTKNQLLNVRLQNLAAHPASPANGQIYENTTDGCPYVWNGSEWLQWTKYVAGLGLSPTVAGGITTFDVNTDGITLEIDGDTVRVKAQGISSNEIKDANVTTIKIAASAVTFAKLQNIGTMTVIGRVAAGSGVASEIPILNEADLVSNSATSLATQASIKAYVDSRVSGIGTLQGAFDAATNTNFLSTAATKKGDYWFVTVAGTVQGQTFNIGDVIIANQNAAVATNANHFIFLESNRGQATTTILGLVTLATNAEVQTGTDAVKVVTPAGLSARTATETRTGLIEIATQAETDTGTDDTRAVTPLKLKTLLDSRTGGYATLMGNGVATSFAITHGLGTVDVIVAVFDVSTGEEVVTDVTRTSTTVVTIAFGSGNVPTNNQYRVTIKK